MADIIFKGEGAKFSFAKETNYAETPTQGAQTIWMGIIPSATIDVVPDYNDYYTITQESNSVQRDLFTERQGKLNCTGSFPLELQNGRILYYAMGHVAESGTSPTTHTISGAGSQLPSLVGEAVYRGTNQNFMRYIKGMRINTYSIEAAEGAQVSSTVNFINSKTYKSGNSVSTVTVVTTKPFQFYHGCVIYNDNSSYRIVSSSWTVNNNLKPLWDIDSTDGQYATSLEAGKRDYELRLTLLVPDSATLYDDHWEDFINATNRNAKVTLARNTTSDYMQLTAYDCTIRNAPYNLPEVGEEVRVDVVLRPRSCVWVVKDNISSYD